MMAAFGFVCELRVVLPIATKTKSKDLSELFVCVGKGLSTFFLEKEGKKTCHICFVTDLFLCHVY